MTIWDVFLSDRLELRRGLSTAELRAAWRAGEVRDDDLVRTSGSNDPWGRVADLPWLHATEEEDQELSSRSDVTVPAAVPPTDGPTALYRPEVAEEPDDEIEPGAPGPLGTDTGERDAGVFAPVRETAPTGDDAADIIEDAQVIPSFFAFDEDDLDEQSGSQFEVPADEFSTDSGATLVVAGPAVPADLGPNDLDLTPEASRVSLPVAREPITWNEPVAAAAALDPIEPAGGDDDEEAAAFTLARGAGEKVEELDLAAMVDVAFQLVLFFLVTATTVLYKTLEVPRPNPEPAQAASQEGAQQARSLEDLQADYILVEIDPSGAFTIDREPVAADFTALAERLRKARKDTGRTAMLLTADAATLHRNAVLAYDVANEIGLRIAIAKPTARGPNPPPPPPPAAAAPARAPAPAPAAGGTAL